MVVILNGTSSAGKTSIAHALQRRSARPFLHASLDTFTDMFRWDAITDAETRRRCHTIGVANFHRTLPLLTAGEFPVVVDHVFKRAEWFDDCRAALAAKPQLWVGVKCPLGILRIREAARKDRRIDLAAYQFGRVHEHMRYDLEVDTSQMSADDCAEQILRRIGHTSPEGLRPSFGNVTTPA